MSNLLCLDPALVRDLLSEAAGRGTAGLLDDWDAANNRRQRQRMVDENGGNDDRSSAGKKEKRAVAKGRVRATPPPRGV